MIHLHSVFILQKKHETHKIDIKVSHLIPLHKSARFQQVIIENVLALRGEDTEFILADSNGDDVRCRHLREQLCDIPNVRVICDNENLSWVENIARLIELARGQYFQILPQDDSSSKQAIIAMRTALEAAPDAVLAYGRIRAIDLNGNPLPSLDELNTREDPQATNWTLDDVLSLFWIGRFGGAFKGLIRTEIAKRPENYLRSTPTTIHSERVWLFSLALSGRFVFVPEDILHKRYYPESTHRQWRRTPDAVQDAAELMIKAIREKISDAALRQYAIQDVVCNSALRQDAIRHPEDFKFQYRRLPDRQSLRQSRIGFTQS